MKRALILALALTLAAIPLGPAGAQDSQNTQNLETDTVTFYGHVFNHELGGPSPANTEAPVGEDNYGLGSFDWCTPVARAFGAPPVPQLGGEIEPGEDCSDDPHNTLALFSTAGFVQVENRAQFQQEGGYALLHNERGQTKDVLLDTSEDITASIYMTVDFHGWAVGNAWGTNCIAPHPPNVPCAYPYWGWDVGVQPDYVVKATLYHDQLGSRTNASQAPPIEASVMEGEPEIVAQGQWGPEQVMVGMPGGEKVQRFDINLGKPQIDSIPKENDFFLVYEFYSEASGEQVGLHTWRIWSGEFFPPSFTLPVKNAFDVERVIPNFAHGKLAILGVMNTPWGSYDIDPDSVDLEVTGPDGNVNPTHIDRFGDTSVAHGGHFKPINLTWIWDYNQETNLAPGTYEVTISASNFQNSASASCTASFELKEAKGGLAPGTVEEGLCGLQSASEEFLEGVKEGATNDAGGS